MKNTFFYQIFFVLRKKNNQISFLHIYHHTAMAYGVYFYLRFMSGGERCCWKFRKTSLCSLIDTFQLSNFRWAGNFTRHYQLIRSRDNVFLLLHDLIPARAQTVHVVEALYNSSSINSVCSALRTLPDADFRWLWIFKSLLARSDTSKCLHASALRRLLLQSLHQEEASGEKGAMRNLKF